MDLSVVVSTYNRADRLATTLDALCAQRVAPALRWELVVVDNNSTDRTRAVVEGKTPAAPMPIHYVFEPRQGVCFGRNAGIEHAKGRLLAFTDDDVLPAPDWVDLLPRVFEEWGADIVGGRIVPSWARPVPAWLDRSVVLRENLALMEHDRPMRLTSATGGPAQIWGANLAARADVFTRIGGFDTKLGPQGGKLYRGEEPELIDRALARGLGVVYDPRLVVHHRVGAERMRRGYFLRWHMETAEGRARTDTSPVDRGLWGAPLYRYRHLAAAFGGWLGAAALRRRDAMDRALELAEALGRLRGHWQARAQTRKDREHRREAP